MKLTNMLDREIDELFRVCLNAVSNENCNEFDFYVNFPKYVLEEKRLSYEWI